MQKLAEKIEEISKKINPTVIYDNLIYDMSKLLADEYVLYAKLRNYHWNVVGFIFNDLHKFFETNYIMVEEIVDQIAERIRALGVQTPATLAELLKLTRLKEPSEKIKHPKQMLQDLFNDYTVLSQIIRKNIETHEKTDSITANFLAELGFKHEKTIWMLRSLLQEI